MTYEGNAHVCRAETDTQGEQYWYFSLDPEPDAPMLVSVSWRTTGSVSQNGPDISSQAHADFNITRIYWYQNVVLFSRDILVQSNQDINDTGSAVFEYDPAYASEWGQYVGGYLLEMHLFTFAGWQSDNDPTYVEAHATAQIDTFEVQLTPIPEPAVSSLLVIAGTFSLVYWTRRRNRY
jgi:hypothetical protein